MLLGQLPHSRMHIQWEAHLNGMVVTLWFHTSNMTPM
jgi:hypothetical protein